MQGREGKGNNRETRRKEKQKGARGWVEGEQEGEGETALASRETEGPRGGESASQEGRPPSEQVTQLAG